MGEEYQRSWIGKIENDTKITGTSNYEGRENPQRDVEQE